MLEVDRENNKGSPIRYERMSIEDIAFDRGQFDIVISSLAFHYVRDFPQVVRKIGACLTDGGAFVFSLEHPIFTAYGTQDWYYGDDGKILHFPVDRYFYEGERRAHFLGEDIVKYHKTLTTYINSLLTNGFEIVNLVEPQPPAHMCRCRAWRTNCDGP